MKTTTPKEVTVHIPRYNRDMKVEVVRVTKTLIIVHWGDNGEARFSRQHGHMKTKGGVMRLPYIIPEDLEKFNNQVSS